MKKNDEYLMGECDVVVVGAGHAGCEAALAAARMGMNTIMFAIDLESIAMMPCNPAIGGTGKGHLVREIDALGGEMGINIDKAFIQSRMLNTAKGPAVHSLRAQADKKQYHIEMKKTIEKQENLRVKQGEVVDIFVENEEVKGVKLRTGAKYEAKAVVLATGTFLGGKIFIGSAAYESGPSGLAPATILAERLKSLGLPMRRFKTGTPARCLASSLDFTKMKVQRGDENLVPFSFMNDNIKRDQVDCYLTYTNENTHDIIRKNIDRSALFGGQIVGTGPRYCPSIEDKINRFADRKRHQLFVEPEGLGTEEMYIQGMSTSLPEDVQHAFYKTIPGLENLEITRPGYAIEYDCIAPLALKTSLEYKGLKGLFCAGQFNGSSGYEEAAAQGLMAGINAALQIKGEKPFVLMRDEAYIGVLIDDLVLKGTNEPYRMMTSRCEYRLLLRQDNADRRLTEKGYEIGLATEERYNRYRQKEEMIKEEIERFHSCKITPEVANPILGKAQSAKISHSVALADMVKRPEVTMDMLLGMDPKLSLVPEHLASQVLVRIKYNGYIEKQLKRIEKFQRMEAKKLPKDIDYETIDGLRIEARQKLNQMKPESLGQAGRISGVSPADINVLLIFLERERRANV